MQMSEQSRRPRVLVVSLGRRGGTTQYGWLMSRGLARHCDIAVISSTAAENRTRWAEIGCPHLEVVTFSSVLTMVLSLFNVSRFARVRRFACEFDPDVVYYPHGHAWKPLLDLVLPRRAAVVLTVHDPEPHRGEDSALHRILAASNRLRVDGYVLLNEAQRERFVAIHRLDPASVAVIPIGIFDDLVDGAVSLDHLPSFATLADQAGRYALFVGRIQRYKGLGTLLAAYLELPDSEAPPLVIAGAGELTREESELLESLNPAKVTFLHRWLTNVEIASIVASARFVVLPYESATQSGVIPLASAFGVPSLAARVGGIAEQVVEGETGMLFEPHDVEQLAACLRRAFSLDEEAYRQISSASREHAQKNWDWNNLAAELVSFFDRLVGVFAH